MFFAFSSFFCSALFAQAELHIHNNSGRTLTVKIMQLQGRFSAEDNLYSVLSVGPYQRAVEYFSQTGYFYLKTKAAKPGTEPLYSKGDAFEVYVGSDGYSVLTITYDVAESAINPLDGKQISRAEFEKN
ncbi:hypothetical protein BVG80_01500 [Sphingobacteriales bacterium TSM_CSM]|nr:hypothetical protein BVG80_01500 [Sphingobacteriales bacterium TSM_CSM]